MQPLKLRSWSSEMAHKTSPRMPRSPASSDSPESKLSKSIDRKPFHKSMSQPEKRIARVSEMQQQLSQLQEELKKAKEERSQALGELAEAKKGIGSQINENEVALESTKRAEILELEVEKAKESERKMLESIISQTKQLEQTKISLEEAKLEIKSLQENIKRLDGSAGQSSRNLEKNLEGNCSINAVHYKEEIRVLRNELKLATQAEEKSKKAMDDLAIFLKEVKTDASQVKGQLSSTQSELQKVRAEAQHLKALLKTREEKFQATEGESERVKLEFEKSLASWIAKENGFINCMKISEEEISNAQQENDKLINSQRVLREDISKLRDILKQAVNEATVVKETLEIARKENSQLQDMLSEKEKELQRIKQDYECLKVSEAAALDSVRELKSLLAATSNVGSSSKHSDGPLENGSFDEPSASINEDRGCKSIAKFPSENWKRDTLQIEKGHRHSIDGKSKGAASDTEVTLGPKGRKLQSVSNLTVSRVPSSLFSDDGGSIIFDDYDHIDRNHLADDMVPDYGCFSKQKKKKPMLRRFGDMIRRKSFHK